MLRRTFLKLLGGAATGLAAAPLVPHTTAPLYIPAEHLDFGVPKPAIIVPKPHIIESTHEYVIENVLYPYKTVPMILLHDNYIPEHGGRLKAGSIVLEDETTAARWESYHVAVRGSSDLTEPKIIPGRDYRTTYNKLRWDSESEWGSPTKFAGSRDLSFEAIAPPPKEPSLPAIARRRLFQGYTRP